MFKFQNIPPLLIGKMNSEGAYSMGFATTNLSKKDKNIIKKIPDDDRSMGMFIIQGTGAITEKEIVRIPFMEDEKFEEMVLQQWRIICTVIIIFIH